MIRFGTGTYNVRDSEGVQPQLVSKTTATPTSNTKTSTSNLKCTVFFLDDTEHEFEFHKNAIGEELLEKVFSHLELIEKDFFGLQFVCILDVNSTGSQMRWLDSKKSIKRQMMCPPYHLFFRVKFYVSDPSKLIEEYTRYFVYLQLRKDILEGRLTCSESEAALLGSYAAQSEIGDYSAEEHDDNYLADFRVVPVQLPALNTKISQLHRHHHGLYPADAEFRFLDIAKNLQLYGFDLYEAKDGDDLDIVLGVNCNGISIFQNGLALNSFPWAIILKLSFKRKLFYVEMKEWDNGKQKDSLYIFNAVSPPNCKMLWKSCIEHHTFFRLIAPPSVPQKSIFHLGSRFRYSGRTEYQSVEEMRRRALADRNFSRHQSMNMSRPGRLPSGTTNPIDCQQPSSSLSTASHTSNSSAFSATSAGDYASKLTSRCQRFLPRGGPSALLHNNIFRRKMSQLNPMAALPTFLQNLLPRSTSTFKLSKELARPDYDENFGDDECESAAPSLAAHRRSLAAVGNGPSAPPSQSVILRNTNPSSASSTLSLRVRPISRNSTVHATEDLPSPTASSSAYSSNAAQLSLTLPGSSASSSSQYYPGYIPAKEHLKDPHGRYHSPSPYDTVSNTLIGSSSTTTISNGTEESPRIWQSPNHTTTMIINDNPQAMPRESAAPMIVLERPKVDHVTRVGSTRKVRDASKPKKPKNTSTETTSTDKTPLTACTSTVHHKLSLTPNGCRKSMVLNTTSLPSNGLAGSEVTNSKSSYLSSNASNNSTYGTNSHSDYNGTVTRRAMLTGNGSPYKNSTRILQNSNGKIGNGLNSSPRNSVSSFSSTYTNGTSLATNNGYENGSPHTRQSPIRQHSNSPTSITSEDSTVVVRMVPDLQGRFGFNVSGGYDRGYPVIVSRVVPLSPADKCHPRLNVGDMVLKINGQDISLWSYERVVSCIRNIRSSTALGEIQLTIKPNVYRCGEVDDADLPQATPEVTHVSETVPRSDKLATSLTMLKDSLDTGKIVRQFEQLYRKKPGFTMNDSRASMNISKNRYRDVVPYDSTRVRLERAPSGDYINANHVNMEIPSSGIVNRYIATQGPLAHTTSDFWFMVWEQGCTTIVMLTTLVEKGRIKCHQYWPSRKETLECGYLVITNVSERLEAHCQYRELAIRNKNTREERRVTQMQYTAWPDHGVPDNPKHFIDFVGEVRRARNGSLDPIIVHCSAGIGRTGVLILMETASCLIEANEPVYPLDIVRTMRDQRAMLIQTSDQYTFVCESILRAYKEDVIRPLAEYQKCR